MSSGSESVGGHRYGIVLALALLAVVFLIVAPDGTASRAVGLLIVGAMLVVVIATSRSDPELRARGAGVAGLAVVALAATAALGWLPKLASGALAVVILLLTLVQLVRGLVRLLRTRGVTLQALSGALAVYLLLGIAFAFAIGVAAKAGSGFYFAQGTDGSESQHVYFSFTAMTTTGFGDLSPAAPVGRALSVLEMLLGQIYLVTVISLLVGNLRRGPAGEG
jgi:hypothetical protein